MGDVLKIRERSLPDGWYPDDPRRIAAIRDRWSAASARKTALAGIAPHAGWTFCGPRIAQVLGRFPPDIDTVVVLGGHSPPGSTLIEYREDAWSLPSARLSRRDDLARRMAEDLPDSLDSVPERQVDNTVEVVMAMAAAFFPGAAWAAWRVPADPRALEFGSVLAAAAEELDLRLAVVGSTDLTHYGPNYGFRPPDSRDDPGSWVEQRDRAFLEALRDFRGLEALALAAEQRSACSAGAAVAAMEFARTRGAVSGELLSYGTSREIMPSSSFVGYGALCWVSD